MIICRYIQLAAIISVSLLLITSFTGFASSSDGDVEFEYSLPDAGYISAAIYDSDGRQIRTLLYGKYRQAGDHTLSWDGLDKEGRAQSPDEEYTWKILSTPGFTSEKLSHRDFLRDEPQLSFQSVSADQAAGKNAVLNQVPVSANPDNENALAFPEFFDRNSYLALDPSKPGKAFLFSGGNRCFLIDIDFSENKWEVTEMYEEPATDGLFPSLEPRESFWQLRHSNGTMYLASPGGDRRRATPAVYRVDREEKKLIPTARAGIIRDQNEAAGLTDITSFGDDFGENTSTAGEDLLAYTWSDSNNNGKIDSEEFSSTSIETLISSGYAAIDEDWNVYFAPDHNEEDDENLAAWCRLPGREVGESEIPRWEWSELQMSQAELPSRVRKLRNFRTKSLFRAPDGGVYAFLAGHRGPDDDRQGINWPATLNGSVRLLHWNKEGHLKWIIGNAGDDDTLTEGSFQDPGRILGKIRGNLVVEDRGVSSVSIWTDDGLYAGSFSPAIADSELPGESNKTGSSATAELKRQNRAYINGQVWELPTGEVIWQPAGDKGIELYRISGWQDWQRSSGILKLPGKPQAAAKTGDGLQAEYFAGEYCKEPVAFTRRDHMIWFGSRALSGVETPSHREWPSHPHPALFSKPFSVRWSGALQAKFDEEFRFSIELDEGASVRLSINDEEIIDYWHSDRQSEDTGKEELETVEEGVKTRRLFSEAIQLQAGQRYRIKIEYSSPGENPHIHLNWESSISQERQHIPQAFLYTERERPKAPAVPRRIDKPIEPPSPW